MAPQRGTYEYIWNFEAGFRQRMDAFIKASGGQVYVTTGYRSNEHQAELYAAGQAKHGANVNMWVAPPGKSNHNKGLAADLGFRGNGLQWAHQNAAQFGLSFPMAHENWHVEPGGLRNGSYAPGDMPDSEAYTIPPLGADPVSRERGIEAQMSTFDELLKAGPGLEGQENKYGDDKDVPSRDKTIADFQSEAGVNAENTEQIIKETGGA